MKSTKPNVNAYWGYVITKYPNAVFDFWYSTGELLFYPHAKAEHPYSCIIKDGKFTILYDF